MNSTKRLGEVELLGTLAEMNKILTISYDRREREKKIEICLQTKEFTPCFKREENEREQNPHVISEIEMSTLSQVIGRDAQMSG